MAQVIWTEPALLALNEIAEYLANRQSPRFGSSGSRSIRSYRTPGVSSKLRSNSTLFRLGGNCGINMLERIKHNAELVRKVAGEQLDVEVGYDLAGVKWLDGYTQRQFENDKTENVDGLVSTLGSYLGECIVQTYGGTWAHSDYGWCVEFSNGNAVFPFAKIEKHLRNGSDDSVLSLFETIPLVFGMES